MSATLYRKYRPKNFSTVIGQKHIVQTLSNAIKNNHVAQAYLFTGSRGTGKTSIARILAKA
ncbi:MAG: DNA polymerase III subunit gamma/tau, partial [Parcubacteria group bacterium]